ncbi:YfhO family protein [Ruminococcaceae bacterium OttesenSCG-928-D13]|nr:YfhO family protein [Ruminococcaceae bacterium OttesenSCG-928-D13]
MVKKSKIRGIVIHSAAFLLPVLGLAATWALLGVHPFGEASVLTLDMRGQYISFFAYLRDQMLLGGESWLYSFSKALGGDMAGLSAYYLLSPFNLVLLLFPTHALPDGIALVTLLKIGCCGLTMSIFLNRKGLRLASLLFSVPYALMDYNNAFQQNIMWLDGVILLPLVIMGIEYILEEKSPWLYIAALALAIVTCYYIGYMLCLFSLVWFLVSYFCFHNIIDSKHSLKNKKAWRPMAGYAGASLIGAGLSAVALLPSLLSLQGGKAGFSLADFWDKSAATLADVVSRYLPGTASHQMVFMGYPQIYCGVLALVCALMFFLGKGVARRRKIGALILLAVPLLSFIVGPIDRIWHGFNKPVGFLFRYSFIFSFVLLAVGWEGFTRLRRSGAMRYLPYAVAGICLAVALVWREDRAYVTTGKLLLGLGFLVAMALLLWQYKKRKNSTIIIILLLIVLADTGANLYLTMRQMGYYPYNEYSSYVKKTQPAVEEIKARDDSFYRVEYLNPYSENDALLFGTKGLSHYSSSDKMEVREFLEAMGLSQWTNSAKYAGGSTVAVDSLLGVKYLLGSKLNGKSYELAAEADGLRVWQNEQALPVGVMAGGGVTGLLEANENLFEVHNAMWRAIVPDAGDALYKIYPVPKAELDGLSHREFEGEALYERPGGEGSALEYRLTAESDDDLYLLLTTGNYRSGVDVYLNDTLWARDYLTGDKHGILPLGSHSPGSEVVVRLEPKGGELFVRGSWFAYEDRALLAQMTETLQAASYQLTDFSNSRFEGVVENPDGLPVLLLSIPYDKGWNATLDGKPIEIHRAFGTLSAVEIPTGSHTLILRFVPQGLVAGAVISGLSLVALGLWIWRRVQKNKMKNV